MGEKEIGKLVLRLVAEVGDLKRDLGTATSEIKTFTASANQSVAGLGGVLASIKSHWMGITAAITAAVAAYKGVEKTVDSVVTLGKQTMQLQRATGMTAEEASTLIAVADQIEVSFGTISNAITQITRKMGGLKGIEDMVVDSSGKTIDIFEKFNIQIKNSDGTLRSVTDVLSQLRKVVQGAGSETERMTIATQFFRNSSQDMLKFLLLTDDEFKAIADDARRYGIVLKSETLGDVKEFVMAHRDLDDAIQGAKITIGKALLPVLTDLVLTLTDVVAKLKDFMEMNKFILGLPWGILKTVKESFAEISLALIAMFAIAFAPTIAAWISSLSLLRIGLALTTTQVTALSAALGILMGYELGKLIDEWAYKLGHIDISGSQRLKESLKEIAEQQSFILENWSKWEPKLRALGITANTPTEAMKKFRSAIESGQIVFDKFTNAWVRLSDKKGGLDPKQLEAIEKLKKKFEELGIAMQGLTDPIGAGERALKLFFDEVVKATGNPATESMKEWFQMIIARFHELESEKGWQATIEATFKAEDALADKTSELAMELLKLKDPIRANEVAFNDFIYKLIKGIPIELQTKSGIEKLTRSLRQSFKDLSDEQGKAAIRSAEAARVEMENSQQTQTALSVLDSAYERGMMTIQSYYSQKRKILDDSMIASISALETERAEIEKWSDSKQKIAKLMEIETKIREIQMNAQRQGISLNLEESKSLESLRKEKADWAEKLAEAKGDWGGIYEAQIQSLQAIKDMTLATAGLDAKTKRVISDYYDLQIAEAKAKKDMDAFGLSIIGMKKYFLQTKNELVNTFENILPNSLKSFWDEFENYLKTGEMNWKSFADSLKSIWANLMRKMLESLVNDLLKGAISGISKLFTGGATSQGVGGSSWTGLIGSIFGIIGSLFKPSTPTSIPTSRAIFDVEEGYEGGGKIIGSTGIDTIPIRATAGEYMHPISTVKYYGESVMESIRQQIIPRSALLPFVKGYAEGGMVTGDTKMGGNVSNAVSVGPININDPRFASNLRSAIEDVVIRILKEHTR